MNYNSGLSQLWSKHCPLLRWGLRGSPGHQEHLQGDFLEFLLWFRYCYLLNGIWWKLCCWPQPTLKGEEICENYGPIFFHSAKDDRQSRLEKQYWFKCQCIACQENWPLMHEMTQDVLNFRFRGKVKVLRETKLLNFQMWRVRWLCSLPHQLEHAPAEVELKLFQLSTISFVKLLKCFKCNLST